ncbi:MAG: PfkB family carbohydrate kinase [Pseudomonadota bacterium]
MDCFPDREVLGGAPFNVAWHLRALARQAGPSPVLVTRIGRDSRGQRVLGALEDAGMSLEGIQQDSLHDTGIVQISLNQAGDQPSFTIPPDQAWDYINPDIARMVALARRPGRIYFGTLAQRGPSRQALRYLLTSSPAEGFLDVNLRDPWVREDVLRSSLKLARSVKLNDAELTRIATLLGLEGSSDLDRGRALVRAFRLQHLLVTRGAQGAWLLDKAGQLHETAADKAVDVVDSVGAGDAFAAVFLLGLERQWPIPQTLDRAHEFAAALCGQRGAIPESADFYTPFIEAWGLDDALPRKEACP